MTQEAGHSTAAEAADQAYWRADTPAYRRLISVKTALERGQLGQRLLILVYLRVSQINGCAYCMDLHAREATAAGVTAAELTGLARWRESELFSARERGALAWAEAVTRLGQDGPDAELRASVAAQFPGVDLVELTLAAAVMNALNRLSISFARSPG